MFKDELRAEGIQPDQLITMNFEDMDNEPYLQADKLYHHISKLLIPNKMNYVFLDEIQNVDHFEKAVNSLFLKDNVDLYLTGSNAYFLSSDIATVLSGRYVELKMLPLSFKEYVEWNRQNNVVKKMKNYLISTWKVHSHIRCLLILKRKTRIFARNLFNGGFKGYRRSAFSSRC